MKENPVGKTSCMRKNQSNKIHNRWTGDKNMLLLRKDKTLFTFRNSSVGLTVEYLPFWLTFLQRLLDMRHHGFSPDIKKAIIFLKL